VATASPHQRYVHLLMERVRRDTYPSGSDLDRIEQFISTPDELVDYLEYLFEKIEESSRPSAELMNRLERLLSLAAPPQSSPT
jgi:hypothetical protein